MTTLSDDVRAMARYDRWANRRVVGALLSPDAEPPPRAVELYSHVLRAADVWFARIHGDAGPIERLWESFPVHALEAETERVAGRWRELVEPLTADDLRRTVAYRTSSGVEHRNGLAAILRHVHNHGTHHRGQVVLTLRSAGIEPPVTDYIAMVREEGGGKGT